MPGKKISTALRAAPLERVLSEIQAASFACNADLVSSSAWGRW